MNGIDRAREEGHDAVHLRSSSSDGTTIAKQRRRGHPNRGPAYYASPYKLRRSLIIGLTCYAERHDWDHLKWRGQAGESAWNRAIERTLYLVTPRTRTTRPERNASGDYGTGGQAALVGRGGELICWELSCCGEGGIELAFGRVRRRDRKGAFSGSGSNGTSAVTCSKAPAYRSKFMSLTLTRYQVLVGH